MGEVVRLRVVQSSYGRSEAFMAAWKAYPTLGRQRSSMRCSWPEWLAASREVGEGPLLAAVRQYVREDKDHKRDCGAPAFHRWLKMGRYESWISDESDTGTIVRFPNSEVRAAVVARLGEPWCVSYLDRCGIQGATLIVRTETAIAKMREHGAFFKELGFTGLRHEGRSGPVS